MTAIMPRVIIMLHLDTPAFEPLTISPSTKWSTSKEYPVSSKFGLRTACFAGSGHYRSDCHLYLGHYADSSWVLCQALRPQPQPPDLGRGTPSRLQIGRLSSLGLCSTSNQGNDSRNRRPRSLRSERPASPPTRKVWAARCHQGNSDSGCGFEQDIPVAAFLAAHKPRAEGRGHSGRSCSPGSLGTPSDLRYRVRILRSA
jgi:hypothetical protein